MHPKSAKTLLLRYSLPVTSNALPSISTDVFKPANAKIVGAKSILSTGWSLVTFSLMPGPLINKGTLMSDS